MSLFSTIGLMVFLIACALGVLAVGGTWAYRQFQLGRAVKSRHDQLVRQIEQAQALLGDLIIEIDCNPVVKEHLEEMLQKRIWDLREEMTTIRRKELR